MTRRFRVIAAMLLGALLTVAAMMGGGRLLAEALASDSAPEIVNYQGFLTDSGGNPISSTVTLQFSIWDASSGGNQVWSETHNNVTVSGGYFSVFLGSQGTPLTPSVFSSTSRYLEVTFGATTFSRQRFASVPYALVAQKASTAITSTYATTATYASSAANATNAANASQATTAISSTYATTATYALNAPGGGGSVAWEKVVVVAKSGGDYTSITDAMNAITPSSVDRYLVLVMPGVYVEQVVLKEYVHLKGAGVHSTIISSQANNANFNNDAAVTMRVPANVQVSDLTVRNDSASNAGVAMKIATGNESTILNNVRIETIGAGGTQHIALYLNSGTPRLTQAYVVVSGGASNNWGIFNSASTPTIQDSTVAATGNGTAGLRINGGGPKITDSSISGTNGTDGEGINTAGGGNNVYIDRSTITGDVASGNSIISTDNINFFVGTTLLKAPALHTDPNRISCIFSYDENYLAVNADCQ